VYIENPDHRETDTWQSLKGYKPGTNATFFSPQGGLRISYGELGHDLEFLINGGIYKGKRILKASSLAEMIKPQWIYNPQNAKWQYLWWNYRSLRSRLISHYWQQYFTCL
jgi:CubicO group peptidase (beta-lactamase class C family)